MTNIIPAAVRNAVWNTYIGTKKKQGKCFCCDLEKISYANFECGHIQAKTKEGDITIPNLRPICSLCNKSMNNKHMEVFIDKYKFKGNKNWNGVNNFSDSDEDKDENDACTKYKCVHCDYTAKYSSNWSKHKKTKSHLKKVQEHNNSKEQKNENLLKQNENLLKQNNDLSKQNKDLLIQNNDLFKQNTYLLQRELGGGIVSFSI